MNNYVMAILIGAIPVLIVGCNSERRDADKSAQPATTNTPPSTNTQAAPTNDIRPQVAMDGRLQKKGDEAGRKLPTEKPQPPDVDIFTASGEGNLQVIKQHIATGTDLDAKEPVGGGTPLIVTTVTGQTEAARLLIENGASPNATNNDGATALHTAAFFGQPDMVTLLLESGADVNAKNKRGETPLDTVAVEWTDDLQGLYRMIAVMFQLDLDLERIRKARPVVAEMLRENR
jgi:ankyrin repeat protein